MSTKTKRTLSMIGMILICVMLCAFIGNLSSGFSNFKVSEWSLRSRNSDNLLSGDFVDYNSGDGISVTARNDGTLVVKGEYLGTEDCLVIDVETVTLSAGTYTLSGAPNGGNYTYYLRVSYGSKTVTGDFGTDGGTFTLSSSTAVTVQLVVYPEREFNNLVIRPVLVEGTEAGDFYA